MHKILITIIIGLVLNNCNNSKENIDYGEYYLNIYKADSLMIVKDYNKSFKILNRTFDKFKPLDMLTYYEYKNFIKSGYIIGELKDSTLNAKMVDLIVNYGYTKEYFSNDSILYEIYKKTDIDIIYDSIRKKYLSNINFGIRDTLFELIDNDQLYRSGYTGNDIYDKRLETDLKTQMFLVELFNKDIFPNEKIVGNFLIEGFPSPKILTLLLHTNDSMRLNYFLPKIKKFIKNGQCPPVYYGYMVDQYFLYNGKEQKYGTYNIFDIDKEDYPKYNELRKQINLPSLEFTVWKSKMIMSKISNN